MQNDESRVPTRFRRSALEVAIAWRYLRSRRGSRLLSLISIIAIGGVVVGVSALILIVGVMNGLQHDLREKILIGSPDIRVTTYTDNLRMPAWDTTLAKVRRFPGVTAAAPVVMTRALIAKGDVTGFLAAAELVGIEPTAPGVEDATAIREHVLPPGDFRFASSGPAHHGIVLGKTLAAQLGVLEGEHVSLITRAGAAAINAVTGLPTFDEFEVTAVFETGMYEYDSQYAYVAIDEAQRLAGIGSDVTAIEVRTKDRGLSSRTARALEKALGYPFNTTDWQEQNGTLFQALKLQKLGMSVILLLIVIVAAFNIVSTLTMTVTDKTREIGILKAMGLPSRSVRRIFLLQGFTIGVAGTAAGAILGLAGSVALGHYKFIKLDPAVYFIDHLPVTTEIGDVLMTLVASVVIAALATLYPATQAARLFPIDAIRHD